MSFTLAVSFKYKTGGISRWIYLNFFQANFSCGSKTYQGPEGSELQSLELFPIWSRKMAPG